MEDHTSWYNPSAKASVFALHNFQNILRRFVSIGLPKTVTFDFLG